MMQSRTHNCGELRAQLIVLFGEFGLHALGRLVRAARNGLGALGDSVGSLLAAIGRGYIRLLGTLSDVGVRLLGGSGDVRVSGLRISGGGAIDLLGILGGIAVELLSVNRNLCAQALSLTPHCLGLVGHHRARLNARARCVEQCDSRANQSARQEHTEFVVHICLLEYAPPPRNDVVIVLAPL